MVKHFEVFFPGVKCQIEETPDHFQINSLMENAVRTRVREDTNRLQLCTSDLFDYIRENKMTPPCDTALFILTDVDLFTKPGWTFVFGVTRASLRTLIQSIARHDPLFPQVSQERQLDPD